MMRIITGKAKGVRLDTLDGLSTRPTSEKVKEAVFSMIQFDTEGRRVLDLFAGSGQMALEALSRGAESAIMVDASKEAAEIIRKNAVKTRLFSQTRVIVSDYKAAIKQLSGQKFDLVFCDPPYAAKLTEDAIVRALRAKLISDGALIICESDESKPFDVKGLEIKRHNKYGKSYVTLYEKLPEITEAEENEED